MVYFLSWRRFFTTFVTNVPLHKSYFTSATDERSSVFGHRALLLYVFLSSINSWSKSNSRFCNCGHHHRSFAVVKIDFSGHLILIFFRKITVNSVYVAFDMLTGLLKLKTVFWAALHRLMATKLIYTEGVGEFWS